jgi:cytochrome d ubiquinol oxidase subunit II
VLAFVERTRLKGKSMVIFWVSILTLGILLYGLLCGFDLGIAILFGFAREKGSHRESMNTVAPVSDGNEMWLIVAGVVVCGVFRVVYAALLSAFYLPFLLMVTGLILRGVASERRKTRLQWVWNAAFSGGSLLAAFMQGLMLALS